MIDAGHRQSAAVRDAQQSQKVHKNSEILLRRMMRSGARLFCHSSKFLQKATDRSLKARSVGERLTMALYVNGRAVGKSLWWTGVASWPRRSSKRFGRKETSFVMRTRGAIPTAGAASLRSLIRPASLLMESVSLIGESTLPGYRNSSIAACLSESTLRSACRLYSAVPASSSFCLRTEPDRLT